MMTENSPIQRREAPPCGNIARGARRGYTTPIMLDEARRTRYLTVQNVGDGVPDPNMKYFILARDTKVTCRPLCPMLRKRVRVGASSLLGKSTDSYLLRSSLWWIILGPLL